MDVQDITNHPQSITSTAPLKQKHDNNAYDNKYNLDHDDDNNKQDLKHAKKKKTTHTKSKLTNKLDFSGNLSMESGFLASLDEVLQASQVETDNVGLSNPQKNDQSLVASNKTDPNINNSADLDHANNKDVIKNDKDKHKDKDKKAHKNVKEQQPIKTSSSKLNVKTNPKEDKKQPVINNLDVKKIKAKLDTHQEVDSKKLDSANNSHTAIKSLKEAQAHGIASKLEKGQHVKVEVKQTHKDKTHGQSFKVKLASNHNPTQKTNLNNANKNHAKLHEKVVQDDEENLVATSGSQSNANPNNTLGGGFAETGLKNSTVGKVSADAVTGVKASSTKSSVGQNRNNNSLFSGLGSRRESQMVNNKTSKVQQPRPARKHVHIATTMSKINVDIAKSVEGGADRININLRPNNMGRIDVQIDMQQKGAVVIVNVEKQDTLELLQADASSLQQALEGTGMELQGEMQFNLQQNTSDGFGGGGQGQPQTTDEEDDNSLIANGVPTMEALQEARSLHAKSRGGVDLVL